MRLPILVLLAPVLAFAQQGPVVLGYDHSSPQLQFAAAEIRSALAPKGLAVAESSLTEAMRSTAPTRILLSAGMPAGLPVADPRHSSPQSFAIRRFDRDGQSTYAAIGADAAGAMYGGLDLAESFAIGAPVVDADRAPHIAQRGIKYNIPLDARTPSYSDNSDSAQANIPEVWSFDFWRTFLDEMARRRYNVLSLWSLHPFPSIVKVPEYPEVALDDVKRTTVKLDDTFSLDGKDMVRPAMLANLETVRRMTIAEKIEFWREVMRYARDRGIDVYWFTWNIFTWGAEGKHGITRSQTNPVTIDYFRKSVRETVLTYPLLAGMGITSGENMENRTDEFAKEPWLWKTYGEGIRDALKMQPGRQFRLIHRAHQTAFSEIREAWKDYPGPLDLSFKYSIAHMYSSTKPPFIEAALPHLGPKMRTWLTVRNDDIYSFRWADSAYAREYIRNIPGPDKVAGFYMGSDGYNIGRDVLSVHGGSPRPLVMQRQWFSFLLWGRLAYDPSLAEERLDRIVAARFPEVPAPRLRAAWAAASKVFPEITKFSWGDIDLRWFPEACTSHFRHRGFYTVRHFIEGIVMPGSGNLDVLTWRERLLARQPMNGKTPIEVARALQSYADLALPEVAALRRSQGSNEELRLTLGDIEAMSHLGNYYAEKILGAADLALFDKSAEPERRRSAVAHLDAALAHWKRYAAVYASQYKPQLLNRVGYIDIPAFTSKAAADVEMARAWTPGTIKDSSGKPRGGDRAFRY